MEEALYYPIKKLEFDFVYPNCPIELIDGFSCYESESYEYFIWLKLQNVSKRAIKSVTIRLLCYQYANIPYLKIPFCYSINNKNTGIFEEEQKKSKKRKKQSYTIPGGSFFGKDIYIRLPQSYFKKLEVEILSVVFADGETMRFENQDRRKLKKFENVKSEIQYAYDKINKYEALESIFPIKNIPLFEENAWVCCCGHKNITADTNCKRCRRSLEWQKATVNEDYFFNVIRKEEAERVPELKNIMKAEHLLKVKQYENPIELEAKRRAAITALENVEKHELEKVKRMKLVVKQIFWFGLLIALILGAMTFIILTKFSWLEGPPA